VRVADEAVEISDLRGIVDIGQRRPWHEWKMVDQDAKGFNASWDRVWQDGIAVNAAPGVLVECSLHQSRHQ
jgi:hypothetical protein